MYKYWDYKKKNKFFAEKLKELRGAMGLTQGQLAENLCVSRSCISNYENGSRYPDYDMIKRIADYFNVLVDYLLSTTDYCNLPVERDKMGEYNEISRRIECCGDKIDISGISMSKKIAIIEFSKYIINSDDGMLRNV